MCIAIALCHSYWENRTGSGGLTPKMCETLSILLLCSISEGSLCTHGTRLATRFTPQQHSMYKQPAVRIVNNLHNNIYYMIYVVIHMIIFCISITACTCRSRCPSLPEFCALTEWGADRWNKQAMEAMKAVRTAMCSWASVAQIPEPAPLPHFAEHHTCADCRIFPFKESFWKINKSRFLHCIIPFRTI